MKDMRGCLLNAGDTVVAAIQPYRNRYDLVEAKVTGFTPKMVRIWYNGEEKIISPYKVAKVDPLV